MVSEQDKEKFYEEFPLIRKAVGWSAQEFGDKLQMKRQTINNIEKKKVKLTMASYIAMRFVLEEEMKEHKEETEMLKAVLDAFVDRYDKYSDEQRAEIRKRTELVSSAIKTKTISRKDANNEWKALLALSIIGGSVLGIITSVALGAWRKK